MRANVLVHKRPGTLILFERFLSLFERFLSLPSTVGVPVEVGTRFDIDDLGI